MIACLSEAMPGRATAARDGDPMVASLLEVHPRRRPWLSVEATARGWVGPNGEGAPHGILSVTITPGMLMRTPMSETTYGPEQRARWVDPIRLAPAFARLARDRPLALSGRRLDAWALSQQDPAP